MRENHHQDDRRAFSEQIALVKHAESLGFEQAWVTEHHFNDFSVSSSILMLMAHLAGITSTIKLSFGCGTAGISQSHPRCRRHCYTRSIMQW